MICSRNEVYEWLMFKTEDSDDHESFEIDENMIHNRANLNSDFLNNNAAGTFEDINHNSVLNTTIANNIIEEDESFDDNEDQVNNNNLIILDNCGSDINKNVNEAVHTGHGLYQVSHSIFDCSQECFDIGSKCQHQTIVLPSFKH